MVLKSACFAAVCVGLLAVAVPAAADEYRPDEFLNLDLSKALLSPKRLGPETQFAPVGVEAKADGAQADAAASVWPSPPPRKVHAARVQVPKPHAEKIAAAPRRAAAPRHVATHRNARVKLAHRRGNPLDAQARDTRIQTWPCRSGGICNWQR